MNSILSKPKGKVSLQDHGCECKATKVAEKTILVAAAFNSNEIAPTIGLRSTLAKSLLGEIG